MHRDAVLRDLRHELLAQHLDGAHVAQGAAYLPVADESLPLELALGVGVELLDYGPGEEGEWVSGGVGSGGVGGVAMNQA